jgi:flagellin-like hook-associated protein FlgL
MLSMIARVGTYAQRSSLVQQMTTLQQRMYETQTQLVTEKKSQDYTGIASTSFRLVSVETELSGVQRFRQTNAVAEVRLDTMNTAISTIEERLHDLRLDIDLWGGTSVQVPLSSEEKTNLDNVQEFAFAALQDMTYYLNSRAEGGYLFSGGRTDRASVDLPYANLEDFQDFYDGATITYPDSRTANVANIEVTPNEYAGPLGTAAAAYPPLGATYTLTEAGGAFDDIPVGANIRLTDGDGLTDVYTVLGNNTGTGTLTLSEGQNGEDPANFTGGGVAGVLDDITVETIGYYGGDDLVTEHRVNERRTLALGINAKDPAFEKAIRAMGILAQGNLYTDVSAADSGPLTFTAAVPGTDGGTVQAANPGAFSNIQVGAEVSFTDTASNHGKAFLVVANDGDTLTFADPTVAQYADYDGALAEGPVAAGTSAMNAFRVDDALTLLADAIDHDTSVTGEMPSDIKDVAQRIGFMQVTIDTALEESLSYETFLENRVSAIENVNTTEAAARLQDDVTALELAYQSYARISQLSLQNYL